MKESKHVTDWPCRKCGAKDLEMTPDDDVFEDYHFRCNVCGHSWWEEGADS